MNDKKYKPCEDWVEEYKKNYEKIYDVWSHPWKKDPDEIRWAVNYMLNAAPGSPLRIPDAALETFLGDLYVPEPWEVNVYAGGEDIVAIDIPTWALGYLFNGEVGDLSCGDLKLVREFEKNYEVLEVCKLCDGSDQDPSFCSNPPFGLACNVLTCYCRIKS